MLMWLRNEQETWSHVTLCLHAFRFWYFHKCNTECFIFSKFIYVNYNATFHFSKKESAYIAGSVYMVSMIFGPVMGLIVVSHSKHITVKLFKPGHLEKSLPIRTTLEQRKVIFSWINQWYLRIQTIAENLRKVWKLWSEGSLSLLSGLFWS